MAARVLEFPKAPKYYNRNPSLKAVGVQQDLTAEQVVEYGKCARDPVYFIEKYMRIIHVDKGIIPFDLRDYQKKYIKDLQNNRFIVSKWCRQSGKSTSSVGFMLHYILFNESKTVAILANKGSTSREILGRLKLAYELLPHWLQQGVITWNKGSIEIENGSSVIAASTSSSAIRGLSISLLFVDEVAHIRGTQWLEFFDSVYPTISSGEETKVILVSTPKGMNHFYKIWIDSIEKRSEFIANEINWWDVPGRDEEWARKTIANIGQETFDQEFGSEFLGSTGTLINSQTLRRLVHKTPIAHVNSVKVYENPIEGHEYVLTVDCSEGVGGDSSAFNIIDISSKPYKQVVVYYNNRMTPLVYPDLIYQTAMKYNSAFVLVEINSVGKQVADILHYDFEYENLGWVGENKRNGQVLMGGSAAKQQNGLRTTVASKRIGCSNIKQLIENNLIEIVDSQTILELSTFIQKGRSFEADDGCKDDIVMSLVVFGWATTQEYFKSINSSDARKAVLAEYKKKLESEMLPAMFSIARGVVDEEEVIVDSSGITWRVAN